MFLFNDVEINLHDKPIEIYIDEEKRKYEQAVSECNKWRSLIKTIVWIKITVLLKKIDMVWSECGEILNASEISNVVDEIDGFCNKADNEKLLIKTR